MRPWPALALSTAADQSCKRCSSERQVNTSLVCLTPISPHPHTHTSAQRPNINKSRTSSPACRALTQLLEAARNPFEQLQEAAQQRPGADAAVKVLQEQFTYLKNVWTTATVKDVFLEGVTLTAAEASCCTLSVTSEVNAVWACQSLR